MVSYINAHAALDSLRRRAKEAGAMGPRAMVVGPQDSGKSTLCRTLLNYAVRANWKPTFVDLDVRVPLGRADRPHCMETIAHVITDHAHHHKIAHQYT